MLRFAKEGEPKSAGSEIPCHSMRFARASEATPSWSSVADPGILDSNRGADPKLKSYAPVTPEQAMRTPHASTPRRAAKSRGPSAMAVGRSGGRISATTAGVPTRRIDCTASMWRQGRDPSWSRLRQGPARDLGKMQMTEGAYGAHHPTNRAAVILTRPTGPACRQSWFRVATASGLASLAGVAIPAGRSASLDP